MTGTSDVARQRVLARGAPIAPSEGMRKRVTARVLPTLAASLLAAACQTATAAQPAVGSRSETRPFSRVVAIAIAPDQPTRRLLEDALVAALGAELTVPSYRVFDSSTGEDAATMLQRYRAHGIDGALVVRIHDEEVLMRTAGGWSEGRLNSGGGEPDLATYSVPRVTSASTRLIRLQVLAVPSAELVWQTELSTAPALRFDQRAATQVARSVAQELRRRRCVLAPQ